MEKGARVYVAGHRTLIGAALLRKLEQLRCELLPGASEEELDLTDSGAVEAFFTRSRPEYVFLVGGKSGGIKANRKYPAELMRDNLLAECHVIHSAHCHQVSKLLYLASSCVYPRLCPQPMPVGAIMTGPLEPTNEAYAVAKIAGLALCQAYRQQYGANFVCAIPANIFGPGDDFSEEDSHVIAALLRRMHEAKVLGKKSVEIWGSGLARREFIFADDLADASVFTMRSYGGTEPINIGVGSDLCVRELAELIREVVGYSGELLFDSRQPDGMPAKLLDSSRLRTMGWEPKTSFPSALAATYRWFLENQTAKGSAGVRAVL